MRTMFVCVVAAIFLAGCTSNKHTITTSNGTDTVTTSGDNQTVTVQGKEGTFVAGKGAVDIAKLGLPVYPGANQSQDAGYAATSKEGSGAMALVTTTDSFDKVYAWYQKEMPKGSEQVHMSSATGSMAVFQVGKESDKNQKSVAKTPRRSC